MSATGSLDAFQSYLDKWLEAEPGAHLLRLFVPEARSPGRAAALVLLHELEAAGFALEAQPAQAKLAWWQEELGRWRQGAPRHPITRALGDPGEGAAVAALPAATARWLELDTVARFEQWLDLAVHLGAAQARALADASSAGEPDPAPVLARILSRYPRIAADSRGLLPLDVLAEAGATRAEVASAPEGAASRRVLAELARRALAAPAATGHASRLALARACLARATLARMARGLEPERAVRPGIGTVLGLRRELRRRRTG